MKAPLGRKPTLHGKIRWVAFAAAALGMGMSMPSCPGQQAMQQQIDALTAKTAESDKRLMALNAQMGNMSKDLGEARTLVAQVSQTVLAQKDQIAQMDTAIKA